ncbi:hypothetical protein JCM19275_629 [Nonlabens ulvanivorans]|uniref:Uncharacterized protein n=1 Tax=Nonlabens ulvanivorans TaxID=906888 RepID=A0A090WJ17_NONUL|nr:hypothetical protein [Nonlabens ulvanivorans]GAL76223.1 hypothetical protein JCM19275_629 [Nonlabens ulvanivorans]
MKFRLGNWKIDVKSLVRIHWKKYYPKLIVHEKFEKPVKWILRILTVIGIATSFLTLPYWLGIVMTFVLFGMEQFFERAIFEYSVMILQPFPDFEIDYDQWLTNGYMLLNPEIQDHEGYLNYFGPAYADREYAIKFFNYIRSWNQDNDTDEENNICISFIIESDVTYSTYLYANPDRKWLDPMFSNYQNAMKLEKYGKQQQSMVMQMVFWKNLRLQQGMFFHQFREQQNNDDPFFFVPFYIHNDRPIPIEELRVWKTHFKIKGRSELTPEEVEYHHR